MCYDRSMPTPPAARSRLARFFYMHLGSLVAVVVYFNLNDRAGWTLDGLRHALWIALGVKTGYMVLARLHGELKHFDVGLWLFFAIGALATSLGIGPIEHLYQRYSPALVFVTLGLAATVPLLFGWDPFTVYYAQRQVPRWQQKLPTYAVLNRLLSAWWALLFFLAAGLCIARPTDPMFTLVYPNLLVMGVGFPGNLLLPWLYMKLYPPPLPDTAEGIIMAMPMVFNRQAAGDAAATIQFRVSGTEPGDYYLQIGRGRCVSMEGQATNANLTVHTPDEVWTRIAHGRLDGQRALAEGLYRAEGDYLLLARLSDWFRAA